MSVDALTSSYTNALLEPSPALTSDERSVPGDRPIVSLRNVSKRFDGARGTVEAVVDVSLDIARGEIFGIIGRSGAGKSTLVRCMNLLERPTSGSVVIDDVDLVALPPAALRGARRRIGMIFQHFNLLSSRTVYENVALPLELAGTDKRAIAARVPFLLELVGLADLANRYPAQVSGGQKQRIGIARALANEPKVLLSDEATSALDPETTRSILGLLADINRKLGLTIVLITHQMQVVQQVCERLAVMDRGRVVEVGPTRALFERPESEAARTLVHDVVRQSVPREAVRAARRWWAGQPARLWRLSVKEAHSGQPVLSRLVRDFGLDVEVLQGHVEELRGAPFGSLLLIASGTPERLALALADLRARGYEIEEVDDVA